MTQNAIIVGRNSIQRKAKLALEDSIREIRPYAEEVLLKKDPIRDSNLGYGTKITNVASKIIIY
jgi:hypothetical protein